MRVQDTPCLLPSLAFLSLPLSSSHFTPSGRCGMEAHAVLIERLLMTKSVAHLFMCGLFTGIFSFEKCSVDSFKNPYHCWLNFWPKRPGSHGEAPNIQVQRSTIPSKTSFVACVLGPSPPLDTTNETAEEDLYYFWPPSSRVLSRGRGNGLGFFVPEELLDPKDDQRLPLAFSAPTLGYPQRYVGALTPGTPWRAGISSCRNASTLLRATSGVVGPRTASPLTVPRSFRLRRQRGAGWHRGRTEGGAPRARRGWRWEIRRGRGRGLASRPLAPATGPWPCSRREPEKPSHIFLPGQRIVPNRILGIAQQRGA